APCAALRTRRARPVPPTAPPYTTLFRSAHPHGIAQVRAGLVALAGRIDKSQAVLGLIHIVAVCFSDIDNTPAGKATASHRPLLELLTIFHAAVPFCLRFTSQAPGNTTKHESCQTKVFKSISRPVDVTPHWK